jgi:carboxylate-amine ligase
MRVPDTPLDITCASDLAAYAQALAMWLRARPASEHMDDYVYRHNRFHAARFGLDGQLIAGPLGERISVREDILQTLRLLGEEGSRIGATDALARIRRCAEERRNGARWLREALEPAGSLPEMMRAAAQRFEEGCATRPSRDTANKSS